MSIVLFSTENVFTNLNRALPQVAPALVAGVDDPDLPSIEFETTAPVVTEVATNDMATGSLFKALQDVGVPMPNDLSMSSGSMFSVADFSEQELAGPGYERSARSEVNEARAPNTEFASTNQLTAKKLEVETTPIACESSIEKAFAEILDEQVRSPAARDVRGHTDSHQSDISIPRQLELEQIGEQNVPQAPPQESIQLEEASSPVVWEDRPQKETSHQEFRAGQTPTAESVERVSESGSPASKATVEKERAANVDIFNSVLSKAAGNDQDDEVTRQQGVSNDGGMDRSGIGESKSGSEQQQAQRGRSEKESEEGSSVDSRDNSPPPLIKLTPSELAARNNSKATHANAGGKGAKNKSPGYYNRSNSRGAASVVPQSPAPSFPTEFSFEKLFARQMELLKAKGDESGAGSDRSTPTKRPSPGVSRNLEEERSPSDSRSKFNNSFRKKAPVPTFSGSRSPTKRRSNIGLHSSASP